MNNIFADDIFKRIFFNGNVWILIKFSLKFVPKGPINNIPALVQIMAWRRSGNKPLSKPMMVRSTTHICITRPQWVKKSYFQLLSLLNTVECHYNAVQYITVLHTALQWQLQNINKASNSQQTPHSSPSQASYGVFIVRIWEKIDCVITAPCCTQMAGNHSSWETRTSLSRMVNTMAADDQVSQGIFKFQHQKDWRQGISVELYFAKHWKK